MIALFVLSDLEFHRILPFAYPPDGYLLGQVQALVQIIEVREHLLNSREADTSFRIRFKLRVFLAG